MNANMSKKAMGMWIVGLAAFDLVMLAVIVVLWGMC